MVYLITSGGGYDDPLFIHGYYPNRQLAEDWLSNQDQTDGGGGYAIQEVEPGEILPAVPVLYAVVEESRILFSDASHEKVWQKYHDLGSIPGPTNRFNSLKIKRLM
jgi:hypothetical protein